ncbi:MAG: Asp-tRNA(Asn)/Glu-tRNA(Gln) amidotransferase subunit GatC [bacterium]|nr:Asp-tRNA(Asn)/Glu-tRNA(Gln) amidotransferase subunit GatC [bacterium]
MFNITKKEIEHLAELSRLEVSDKEITKLEHDLGEILNYFNELKEVNTDGIKPLTGGTDLMNSIRIDEPERTEDTGKGKDQFPEKEDGYLKVPSVFND